MGWAIQILAGAGLVFALLQDRFVGDVQLFPLKDKSRDKIQKISDSGDLKFLGRSLRCEPRVKKVPYIHLN